MYQYPGFAAELLSILTCCNGVVSCCVAAHGLLHNFVCREVHSMRRSFIFCQITVMYSIFPCFSPAPSTTLETPLHNDMYPSALEMVEIALPIPV